MEFTFFERDLSDSKSISSLALNAAKQAELNKTRLPNTIHGSSYWTCPHAMLLEAYGVPYSDYNFNWSNRQSAEAGNSIHELIQNELLANGLIAQIPAFDADDKIRKEKRKRFELSNAIEVDLTKLSEPYTPKERKGYEGRGIKVMPKNHLLELQKYRLGIRIDSIVKLPWYENEIPCEIKTIKPSMFPGGKNEKLLADKMLKYMYQLQMQMAWYRDSRTGEIPEWGIIYLVNRGDTSQRIERYVKYDKEFIEMWLPEIEKIKLAWDNKDLLPPVPNENECGWCHYYSVCPAPNKPPHIARFVQRAIEKRQNEKGY